MEWQPIKTAPKDGTKIFVNNIRPQRKNKSVEISVAFYKEHSRGSYWSSSPVGYVLCPTHWMPLPEPPK